MTFAETVGQRVVAGLAILAIILVLVFPPGYEMVPDTTVATDHMVAGDEVMYDLFLNHLDRGGISYGLLVGEIGILVLLWGAFNWLARPIDQTND